MTGQEKIRHLLDEGLSVQEVAKKTGYKVNTVRTYQYKFRKEGEPMSEKADGKLNKLERENATLKAELKAAEVEVLNIKQELSDYKREKVTDSTEKIERLEDKLYKKNQRITEIINDTTKEIEELEKELRAERTKHKLLLNYTVIAAQEESHA